MSLNEIGEQIGLTPKHEIHKNISRKTKLKTIRGGENGRNY